MPVLCLCCFCPIGLTSSLSSGLWIGLNSLSVRSGWQWAGGSPFRYLNWLPGKHAWVLLAEWNSLRYLKGLPHVTYWFQKVLMEHSSFSIMLWNLQPGFDYSKVQVYTGTASWDKDLFPRIIATVNTHSVWCLHSLSSLWRFYIQKHIL